MTYIEKICTSFSQTFLPVYLQIHKIFSTRGPHTTRPMKNKLQFLIITGVSSNERKKLRKLENLQKWPHTALTVTQQTKITLAISPPVVRRYLSLFPSVARGLLRSTASYARIVTSHRCSLERVGSKVQSRIFPRHRLTSNFARC